MNTPTQSTAPDSNLPHRLAVALACVTFPLVWVGGLVTTTRSGMAVPNWPNTYGYNLFLYPLSTWIYGPWQLFIEHGHRLLGSMAGLVAILLLAVAWRYERRASVRWLAVAALVLVIVQGVLGGMRVRLDSGQLAKLHGCVGPAFFALTVVLAANASPRWPHVGRVAGPAASRLRALALITALLAYGQLVLGAQLRHVSASAGAGEFQAMLYFHLLAAGLLLAHVALVVAVVLRQARGVKMLVRPAALLAGLMAAQLALGAGTWLAKYGAPAWLDRYQWAAGYTVAAESRSQVLWINFHVVTGSLILATAVLLAVRSCAGLSLRLPRVAAGKLPMGVAI